MLGGGTRVIGCAMNSYIPEEVLDRFSHYVTGHMGLYFPPERWPDLQRGLVAASGELGFDDAAMCARWMMAEQLTRTQRDVLACHLTIGETYFFRERPLFDALAERILPMLIGIRRAEGRRLRLWSAGCCTGEEPYSLAILLRRLIPDLSEWAITLLASDINPLFLKKAEAGEFREWSFRDTPAWIKEQGFKKTSEGHYTILPEIKKMVTFFPLNLVGDFYPSLLNDTNAMDLILCRNVVMYFSPEQGSHVMQKLSDSLVEGGWLGVSPVEIPMASTPGLVAEEVSGVTIFRRCKDKADEASSLVLNLPPPATGEQLPAVAAQALANEGKLEEALMLCEKAIGANRYDSSCHYLRATILHEQGRVSEAVREFHRALTLKPDFVLAHFALGNVARKQRKHKEAGKYYKDVLRLLKEYPPEDVVPHSEGLTVGRLAEIVTTLIDAERAA